LKVSNFEQTIAGYLWCFGNHRGIALSGPIQRHLALFGLVALCTYRKAASVGGLFSSPHADHNGDRDDQGG
jgi:hypothetical protein